MYIKSNYIYSELNLLSVIHFYVCDNCNNIKQKNPVFFIVQIWILIISSITLEYIQRKSKIWFSYNILSWFNMLWNKFKLDFSYMKF